uniref:Uncharacterized protein n=1 Tax=Rhizophagus irregularis (strain DAOM 181602 / DAOM 197198 / MUCL 43194) TaxID=747089 RepID=U9UIZ0_RHIID
MGFSGVNEKNSLKRMWHVGRPSRSSDIQGFSLSHNWEWRVGRPSWPFEIQGFSLSLHRTH